MNNANFITLLTDKDGDLKLGNGSFVLATESQGVAEKVKQHLKLQLGSSLYDLRAGFPWDLLLGSTNPVAYNTRIKNFLRDQPFIQSVDRVSVNLDTLTRNASVRFSITTTLGQPVDVSFETIAGL